MARGSTRPLPLPQISSLHPPPTLPPLACRPRLHGVLLASVANNPARPLSVLPLSPFDHNILIFSFSRATLHTPLLAIPRPQLHNPSLTKYVWFNRHRTIAWLRNSRWQPLFQFSLSPDPSSWGAQIEPGFVEPDDYLHNPDPRRDRRVDKGGSVLTGRGLANLGCLVCI